MPRIINATFTPFTYDELAAPLREATAAHQAQEQKYDELMSDADKMRAFLNEDWQSYKDYEDYVNRLNAAAEELARNGLSRQTQRQLLGLRRDYNGKIQAINAGILSRQNAIENFNKSAKGQSSRYIGSRPEDYSVDEYMYGNNPFKIGVDGSEINKYAEDSAKAIADRRYNEFTKDGYRISEIGIDPLTTQIVLDKLKNGGQYITEDEAKMYNLDNRQLSYMNAVIGDLSNAVNDTMTSFGYDSFTDFDFNGNPVKSNK